MNLVDKISINDKEYFCVATVVLDKTTYKVMQNGEVFYQKLIDSEIKLIEINDRKTLNKVYNWVRNGNDYGRIL